MLIFPISSLENEFDPQNTACMPAVKLIFRLELEKIIYSVTACRQNFQVFVQVLSTAAASPGAGQRC
jgi:hypothetical protein